MIIKARLRSEPVQAVQVTWENWGELCNFAQGYLGAAEYGKPSPGYQGLDGSATGQYINVPVKIGIDSQAKPYYYNAQHGDWVVKEADGSIKLVTPKDFDRLYQVEESKEKVSIQIDKAEPPKLPHSIHTKKGKLRRTVLQIEIHKLRRALEEIMVTRKHYAENAYICRTALGLTVGQMKTLQDRHDAKEHHATDPGSKIIEPNPPEPEPEIRLAGAPNSTNIHDARMANACKALYEKPRRKATVQQPKQADTPAEGTWRGGPVELPGEAAVQELEPDEDGFYDVQMPAELPCQPAHGERFFDTCDETDKIVTEAEKKLEDVKLRREHAEFRSVLRVAYEQITNGEVGPRDQRLMATKTLSNALKEYDL